MSHRLKQIIRKQAVRVLGVMLLMVLAACQSQASPIAETAPTLSQAVTASLVPATPPARLIAPDNAARVTRLAQLGDGTVYGRLELAPDGKTLAVPTTLGVDLYDAETLTKIQTLRTGGYTSHTAFSPDGSILATDTAEDTIQLWDVHNGSLFRKLTAHSENTVFCMDLAFSPDGKTVAAGCGDVPETSVWNVEDGELLHQLEGYQLSYAPDGKKLLTMQWDEASSNGTRILRVYDLSDGSLVNQWEGLWGVFSPGGGLAVEQDGAVRIWDLESDRALQAFNGKNVTFSERSDRLALFSGKAIEIYNLTDGTLEQTLQGTYENVDHLLFSPEGDTLAGMITTTPLGCCGAGEVDTMALWRISDGSVLKTAQVGQYLPYYAFIQNGALLAVPNANQVDFLQTSDGTVAASLEGYSPHVAGIAFSPDGKVLAAASGGSTLSVQLWQTADAQPLQRVEDSGSVSDFDTLDVAFSPDGKTLAVRGDFWGFPNGELMTDFQRKMVENHPFWPESVAFMPQGQIAALGSMEGTLSLWDVVGQKLERELETTYTGQVISLDISRDGTQLAAVYDYPDYVVQVWQVPEGKPSSRLSGKHFTQAIFSPDGQTLATIAVAEELEGYGQYAGPVQLWRVSDGQELMRLDLRDAFSLAFSPDGHIVATGSMDGSVRLWRVGDGGLLQTLREQTAQISDVAFSPDGVWLASSSLDGTVLLWGIPDK